MKANDIFISYSTKNTDTARAIRKLFQDHGITCWMAPESIPAGSNYTKEIPYGILYSKIAILIVSNASLNSIWVNHEVEYLVSAGHIIIPFIIENIDENPHSKQNPFSDILDDNQRIVKSTLSDSYQKLLSAVQHLLGKVHTAKVPDSSDDLLQLGLKDLSEDGGLYWDDGKAEYYLTKSAELGNPVAMRWLAELIYSIGDANDAQVWWTKAAENGDIPAQIHEAYRLLNKDETNEEENLRDATDMLLNSVQNNNLEGSCLYATLLLRSENPYYDCERGRVILEKCLNQGYNNAAIHLGDIYKEAIGVEECPVKSFKYYKIACDSEEYWLANLKLADCYFAGYGTRKNLKKAFELYQNYCYYSDEYIEKYADSWYYGFGTEIDKGKALEMYQRSNIDDDIRIVLRDDIQNRVLLKRMELNDESVLTIMANIHFKKEEYSEAYELYTKGSKEHNNPEALVGMAICLLYGYGVKYNYHKAFELLSLAYSMKYQKAAQYLAQCYEYGIGVTKNLSIAKYFHEVEQQDNKGLWTLSFI